MTPLLKTLGISVPIIQAPMAGVSTPMLAAAVSEAGALGALGIGAMRVDTARAAIRAARTLTSRPFQVNVFCHNPAVSDPVREAAWLSYLTPHFARFGAEPPSSLREIYKSFNQDTEMLAMLLEERPAVVSFHFGLPPAAHITALRDAGIVLLASATNTDEARQVADADLDAVIAQGIEAGGHRSVFDPDAPDDGLGTLALTRMLVRDSGLPVIAAGGIMDGAGIAAALSLGAHAAQLGTAFICCPESAADATYRAALLGPAARHTVLTRAISGRPARGLANRFTAIETAPRRPTIPDYPIAYDAGKALHAAAKAQDNSEYAAQWAGQAAPLSRALPAAELVTALQAETQAASSLAQSNS